MDFSLTDEQREFKADVPPLRRRGDPARGRQARRRGESTPWEVIKAARERGLHGIEHMQRLGARPRRPARASSTPRSCTGAAPGSRSRSPARPSPPPGSPRPARPSRSRSGSPSASGSGDEVKLGAYAVTEPQAGSDVKSLRTTAKLDGDEWVLNGTKVFITNGGIADVHVVVATVDPELGHRGQASFVIGKGTPGLRQGKKETKLGIRASHTAEVVLEDCRDPGREPARRHGQARAQARARALGRVVRPRLRTRSRPSSSPGPLVGASALGIAQAAYEWTLAYLDNGGSHRPHSSRRSTRARPRASRRSSARRSSRSSPTSRPRSRPRACSSSAPRGWAAPAIPMTGGQGSMSKLKARRRRDVGDADADGPRRPLRAERPSARSRSGSATRRSTSCSRARPRSSGW